MRLEEVFPHPRAVELSGYEELRQHFAAKTWPAPSFLLNLVTNSLGQFVGATNSSRDISNDADYQSLMGYRQAADVILTTAHTARIERYRRSKLAPLALVSASGDFSGIPAIEAASAGPADSRVYLLVRSGRVRTTRKQYNQPWVKVVAVGGGSQRSLVSTLQRLGWQRVLVEAGPHFANWLMVRGGIDTAAIAVVDFKGQSPERAAAGAFQALGITEASLESAELVAGTTLFTRWVNLKATPL